ncbi:MAG: MMPL family transporter [Planctomycetaceae bacterium]|nr:MMPL family transporter [Planctomycetaceae bacterium]
MTTRSWAPVLVISAVMICAGAWHLQNLRSSVRIETLFPSDSRILSDYRWIEQHVGPLVPIDVVMTWPADSTTTFPQRLAQIDKLQKLIAQDSDVGATLSAVQFLPAVSTPDALPPSQLEAMLERLITAARPTFLNAGFVAETEQGESWRVTARVSSMDAIDYSLFLTHLRESISPEFSAQIEAGGLDIRYTGIMPLVHEIQALLMHDLIRSFAGAVLTITIIMTITQGDFAAGLVSMIPNVTPIILLFGFLGWQNIPLDIGTVMTASVALGIAVDDTLHYLSFFQRGVGQGLSRAVAVRFAYRHCSTAMVQTSIICGLGMLVFCLSDFSPTSRFAWMTSSMIATSLLADLLLLPALLLSPLGRRFVTHNVTDKSVQPMANRYRSDETTEPESAIAQSA